MTAADLVLMMGVTIGSVAALGAVLAVLLLWFRGSLRKLAALVAGAGGFVLVAVLLTRLSPDALAMAVGLAFGALACLPAFLLVRSADGPHARAREGWYLDAEEPAGYLDDDWGDEDNYIDVVAIERKQLTGGKHGRL